MRTTASGTVSPMAVMASAASRSMCSTGGRGARGEAPRRAVSSPEASIACTISVPP
jgi:hypothetical protein